MSRKRPLAADLPVGTILREDIARRMPPIHVRGHVDDVLIVRRWTRKWGGCWVYDTILDYLLDEHPQFYRIERLPRIAR